MKLIKTFLRSSLNDGSLSEITIESPDVVTDNKFEEVVDIIMEQKE